MTKRKDGLWQEALTVDGKRRFFYGHSKKEVLQKINDYHEEKKNGRLFSTAADAWLKENISNYAVKVKKLRQYAVKQLVSFFGDYRTTQITPVLIQKYINSLTDAGYVRNTINGKLSVLKMILQREVLNGDLATNPAQGMRATKKAAPSVKRECASDDDIEQIKKYTGPGALFLKMALYTGCRRGELLALEWADVDREKGIIIISKSVTYDGEKPVIKLPKTESGIRTVPIIDALAAVLPDRKSGLVFPGKNGQQMKQRQARTAIESWINAAGICCTMHQLRHAYASLLLEADIDVKDAQALLGHANAHTTQDIYQHIREKRRESVFKKLSGVDY